MSEFLIGFLATLLLASIMIYIGELKSNKREAKIWNDRFVGYKERISDLLERNIELTDFLEELRKQNDPIVTDKTIVLAEEPQLETDFYVQPTQSPRAKLVNGQWVLDKEPDGISQHMVDSWRNSDGTLSATPGNTMDLSRYSKYPSWQPNASGNLSWTTGPTVTHLGVWTKPKGGELLGTVKLEDTRSDIIFAKARAEAHDMIVGKHSD